MRVSAKVLLLSTLVLCGWLMATVTACGGEGGGALENTKWVLTAYAVNGSMRAALAVSSVEVTFEDGTVAGTGGCNGFSGSYELEGDRVVVGMLASTQMACEPGIMSQETAFMKGLQATASYEIDGDTLIIMDVGGATLLEFTRAPRAAAG